MLERVSLFILDGQGCRVITKCTSLMSIYTHTCRNVYVWVHHPCLTCRRMFWSVHNVMSEFISSHCDVMRQTSVRIYRRIPFRFKIRARKYSTGSQQPLRCCCTNMSRLLLSSGSLSMCLKSSPANYHSPNRIKQNWMAYIIQNNSREAM